MQEQRAKSKDEFRTRLYTFTLRLIEFIDTLPGDNVSRRIGDQLLRSGTSILANFTEAQSASSKKDFQNFFNHSLKSSNESKLWFTVLRDSHRARAEKTAWFLSELDAFSNIFASSILTMKGRR